MRLAAQAVDLPTLFGRTQRAANEVALALYPGPGGTAPRADPDTLRTFLSSRIRGRPQGAQGWVDDEFDRLAERQLVTADVAARRRIVARMQEIVARDLPALALPDGRARLPQERVRPLVRHAGRLRRRPSGRPDKHALVPGRRAGLSIRRA